MACLSAHPSPANASGLALSGGTSCAVSWAKGPKRSPQRSWAHLSYGVRSTPGDATSAETGLVLMRWRGAGDVAASQGLADGQAIAAKHRQGDAARHLASERCMGRDGDENKNCRLSACVPPAVGTESILRSFHNVN